MSKVTLIILDKILDAVSNYTSITIDQIKSQSRELPVVMARHYYCYIARLFDVSWSDIARYIKRHHSTAISSHTVIEDMVKTFSGSKVKHEVIDIINILAGNKITIDFNERMK